VSIVEGPVCRVGASAVASLHQLQGDNGGFGGDRGEFEQPVGGFQTTVFQLEALGLHEAEERLDCPTLPMPADGPPSRGGVGQGAQPRRRRLEIDLAGVLDRQNAPFPLAVVLAEAGTLSTGARSRR
jgi:hypothetical protein